MSIVTCPKCHRQVSLPTTDDHSVWVRCPLCAEQYSLRMALDHVPPALEILGPPAASAMPALGDMAMHGDVTLHGETPSHAGMAAPADTLAHPEHGASLAPLGAEHFLHGDHGSNGEQPLDLEQNGLLEHSPEHLAEQPPAPNQINGQQHDVSEHLIDFDLDDGEHAVPAAPAGNEERAGHSQDDAMTTAFGEYQGEHTIEPSSGEHSGDGDPEFQFADADGNANGVDGNDIDGHLDAEGGEDAADEQHAMGGIATLVQTAPPAKKRRQAPLMVKLIGVLVGLGFGLIGCYLVYGAFLWMHSDQFHLKQYFPAFLRNRVADEPARIPRHKLPEKLTSGFTPVAQPTSTVDNPAATPAATPSGENPTAVAPPNKPGPTDLAQQSSDKSTSPLETSEDPSKTPPPEIDKPDTIKPDSGLAPSPPPFGDIKPPAGIKPGVDPIEKPSTEKPAADKPSTETPPAKTTDKPPADSFEPPASTPDKAPADKPAIDKPTTEKPAPGDTTNPSAIQSTAVPPIKLPEKVANNPVPDKPADNPSSPTDSKSPIGAQLDSVDSAIKATTEAEAALKSVAVPGAPRSTVLKASVANYKAMSHLVTELGSIDTSATDADSTARIDQLRKETAALAESMGSPAERDTTAMLASKWMASKARKENGVVVVGTLAKVEPSDKGFAVHIKMPSDSKEMTFTTAKKPNAADGSTVVVLGLLTADDGGQAIEIVSPNDEKPAPAADPLAKPGDTEKPTSDKPTADKPTAEKAATDKPAADQPAAEKPTADKPPQAAVPLAPAKAAPQNPAAAAETTKPQ